MACITLSTTAYGQAVPDIQGSITQGSQIDELIRDQDRIGPRRGQDSNEIDGEAGIFVLTVNDIFYVGALVGLGYSANPLRTSDDVGGSFSTDMSATAGVQTRLGDVVDFGVSTTLSGTEYFKGFAPSSRSVNGSISAGTKLKGTPLYIGMNVFGGFNYDGKFKDGTSFFGASASLSAGFLLGSKTFIRPGISFTKQWNGIGENNNNSVALSVNITRAVTSRLNVGLSGRIGRVWFNDFYEDVTFVKRTDWQYATGLSANYVVSENFTLSVSAGYEKRDSTFFLSSYDSFETSLLFSSRLRF